MRYGYNSAYLSTDTCTYVRMYVCTYTLSPLKCSVPPSPAYLCTHTYTRPEPPPLSFLRPFPHTPNSIHTCTYMYVMFLPTGHSTAVSLFQHVSALAFSPAFRANTM